MAIPPAQPRRPLSRWRFTAVVLLAVCLWYGEREWTTPRVDSGSAWRIEFGRGSGMHGLDTAAVGSDGTVVLHRLDRRGEGCWETTTLTLQPESRVQVLRSVEGNRLLKLEKQYRSWPAVSDGMQWVFWSRQGGHEKSVYFDNKFPGAIERFAEDVDRVLIANGLAVAVWQRVPDATARQHERELWDSIRR